MQVNRRKTLTASGWIYQGPCIFTGYFIGDLDGTNAMTVTISNGALANNDEIVCTVPYDATAGAPYGSNQTFYDDCPDGIYVTITGSGTVKVKVNYIPR